MSAKARPEPAATVEKALGAADLDRCRLFRELGIELADEVKLVFGRAAGRGAGGGPGAGGGEPVVLVARLDDFDVVAPEAADAAALERALEPVVWKGSAEAGRPPEALLAGRAIGYAVRAERDVYRNFRFAGGKVKVVSTWLVGRDTSVLPIDGPIPAQVRERVFAATAATRLKKARRLLKARQLAEARAEYDAVLEERPELQAASLERGELELRAGDAAGAVPWLTRAIDAARGAPPEDQRTWRSCHAALFRRGVAQLVIGDRPAALKDLEWLLDADPLHLGALEALADAGDAPRARRRLEMAWAKLGGLETQARKHVQERLERLFARAR